MSDQIDQIELKEGMMFFNAATGDRVKIVRLSHKRSDFFHSSAQTNAIRLRSLTLEGLHGFLKDYKFIERGR